MGRRKKWKGQVDYDNERYRTISTRVPKDVAREFRRLCRRRGETMYEVLQDTVAEYLAIDRAELFASVFDTDDDKSDTQNIGDADEKGN